MRGLLFIFIKKMYSIHFLPNELSKFKFQRKFADWQRQRRSCTLFLKCPAMSNLISNWTFLL